MGFRLTVNYPRNAVIMWWRDFGAVVNVHQYTELYLSVDINRFDTRFSIVGAILLDKRLIILKFSRL